MTRSNVPAPETAPPIPPSGLAASAAELPADVLAAIEREMRTRVSDVPPELVRHAVAVSKKAGNDAFAAKRFADAARFYTQAIAGAPDDKALRSNRSAAYLALGRTEEAVADGVRCVALDARWPKAHYRLGKALAAAGEWHAAASSLETCARLMTGVGLDEKNTKHDGVSRDVSEDSEDTSTKEDTHKRLSVTDAEDAGKKIYVNDSTPNARDAATLDGVLELLAVAQAESEDARSRPGCARLAERTTEKPRSCDGNKPCPVPIGTWRTKSGVRRLRKTRASPF
jgi:tetratricopeptide (TPR) repeat protein